jgi:hypothetical protein
MRQAYTLLSHTKITDLPFGGGSLDSSIKVRAEPCPLL